MNSRYFAALAASALLALACGKSGASARGGPTRTVSGAFTTVFAPLGGAETVLATPPPDGWSVTAALFPEGDGYRSFPLQLDASSRFSASDVPAGPWFLALERSGWNELYVYDAELGDYVVVPVKELALFELGADHPDLSVMSAARPDLVRQASAATSVSLSLGGLDPWESSTRLLIVSAAADLGQVMPFLPGGQVEGAWSGVYPLTAVGLGLPAPGDDVYAFQRTGASTRTWPDGSYATVVTRTASTNTLAFEDGVTNVASFDLTAAPASETASFDVRRSAFAALAGQVRPGTALGWGFATVSVTPGPTRFPEQRASRAEVAMASLSVSDASADQRYDVDHAVPVPTGWTRFRISGFGYGQAPGALLSQPSIVSWEPYEVGGMRPIAPVLWPPTAPRIEGRDLARDQLGVGTTPLLSWSPPDQGTPTHYEVAVSRIDETTTPSVLTATVRGTSFRIPPGFLEQGRYYRALITAVAVEGDDLDAPFREGMPRHSADRATEAFSP